MSSASAVCSGAPIWAHLLRCLSRGSLRRRRPTPQSPLPSPPRIWTLLDAPLPSEREAGRRRRAVDAERDLAGALGVDVGAEEAVPDGEARAEIRGVV